MKQMVEAKTAPKTSQFSDKEKPAQVRSSNIIAAKGMLTVTGVVIVYGKSVLFGLFVITGALLIHTAVVDCIRTSLGPKGMDKMVCLINTLL